MLFRSGPRPQHQASGPGLRTRPQDQNQAPGPGLRPRTQAIGTQDQVSGPGLRTRPQEKDPGHWNSGPRTRPQDPGSGLRTQDQASGSGPAPSSDLKRYLCFVIHNTEAICRHPQHRPHSLLPCLQRTNTHCLENTHSKFNQPDISSISSLS